MDRSKAASPARDAALAWFVRIRSGDATDAERRDLELWLAAAPENRWEYGKLAGVWSDLDRVPDPRRGRLTAKRLARRGLLAGGALLAAGGAAFVIGGLPDFLVADHATGTAEAKTVTLPDGSVAELDADSAVALDFTATARRVALLRGRVFFDVAADADRPFRVEARGGNATALGTQFVVHRRNDGVTVAVQESTVAVTAPDNSGVEIAAGQSVHYGDHGLDPVRTVLVDTESAWRRGKLVFEDQPLRQVIEDVNRYRSGTIRILDDGLLELRVSGIFDTGNPDGVLAAIIATLPVRATEVTRYLVLLRAA